MDQQMMLPTARTYPVQTRTRTPPGPHRVRIETDGTVSSLDHMDGKPCKECARTAAMIRFYLALTPGFREGQLTMAGTVMKSVIANKPAALHAGTGTGKTLGYLAGGISAMDAYNGSGQPPERVVVVTGTKTLQMQLLDERERLAQAGIAIDGVPRTIAQLKGRANYVCPRQIDKWRPDSEVDVDINFERRDQIIFGFHEGLTDRETLPSANQATWDSVSMDSDDCEGNSCPHKAECPADAARNEAMAATVLVTNAAMFSTRVANEPSAFGDNPVIVIDEAHQFPGIWMSNTAHKLTGQMFRLVGLRGSKEYGDEQVWQDFLSIAELFKEVPDGEIPTLELLFDAQAACNEVLDLRGPDGKPVWAKVSSRVGRIAASVEALLDTIRDEHPSHVVWVERTATSQRWMVGNPDTATTLKSLWSQLPRVTLCSATLPSERVAECGVDAKSVPVPSPLPYEHSSLFIPSSVVARHYDEPERTEADKERRVSELVNIIGYFSERILGRGLILFTSAVEMRAVAEQVRPHLSREIQVQGETTKRELTDWLRETPNGWLFGLDSFATGFDPPPLDIVLVTKTPFPNPSDPVVQARMAVIPEERQFRQIFLTEAMVQLPQMAGRLVRTMNSAGLIVICDPRLGGGHTYDDGSPVMKGWGKAITSSLQPFRYVDADGLPPVLAKLAERHAHAHSRVASSCP